MSEKQVEIKLEEHVKGFNSDHVFYSPAGNPSLEAIFKTASKTGPGRGIPDRIIYDGKTLIIIECKISNLELAIADLKKYKDKLKNLF